MPHRRRRALLTAVVAGVTAVALGAAAWSAHARLTAVPVLWSSDFTPGTAWEQDAGVVARGEVDAEVIAEAPDGRRDGLRITFGEGGSRWGMDVRSSLPAMDVEPAEELWLSYDVWFEPGFEFLGDGKMGGLAGSLPEGEPFDVSSGGVYDDRSFSVRAIWTEGGGMAMYLYAGHGAGKDIEDPDNYGYGIHAPFRPASGTERVLTTGRWHRVEHHVRLNTPGREDGVYELWLDGHRGVRVDDVRYRDEDRGAIRIDQVFMSWFYGGPSSTYPTRTNRAWTDDWVLSSERLGERPWRTTGRPAPSVARR